MIHRFTTCLLGTQITWHWQLLEQGASLAAGKPHTIVFGDRQGGTEIDLVLVIDDLSFTP